MTSTATAPERDHLLSLIRLGKPMTLRQQLKLTAVLSYPAMLAQLSVIVMQYIDAAMVGSLGTNASASIGLMATTTWLFGGLCSAAATGFSVQVAHRIGAGDAGGARAVVRQSFIPIALFSSVLMFFGVAISGGLPVWLGGNADITADASSYIMIFMLSLPFLQFSFLGGAMLRCSGNTFFPGMVNIAMCVLDVVFNFFFIFPAHEFSALGIDWYLPGADLGVTGAALGTALSEAVGGVIMMWFLCRRNRELNLMGTTGTYRPQAALLKRACRIGAPLGGERILFCGAQILVTVIVAPLGSVAIAANAFAVTAESLCYMPGYGIGEAATTLVGQSIGAGRRALTRSFARIAVISGIVVMTLMGAIMYLGAGAMMSFITPVEAIRDLGAEILRIEAWAEPMFAAAIVSYGVFVGAGDTLVPAAMNLGSMWAVRITLAAILAPIMGLQGVWIAMAVELTFRGIIFLIRLRGNRWLRSLDS